MSTQNDAVIRLVLQTLGEESAVKITAALKAAAAEANEARDAVAGLGTTSVAVGDVAGESLGDAWAKFQAKADQAADSAVAGLAETAAAAVKAGEAVEDVGRKTSGAATTGKRRFNDLGIEISRLSQDAAVGWEMGGLTGAIRATSNNLEFLLGSLGVGAGLVGALALVAGVAPLVMNALKGAFSEDIPKLFSDRIAELDAKLKELGGKPIKLEVDYAEIDAAREEVEALRAAKGALDKALGKQSEDERASGQRVAEVLAATENRDVWRGRRETLIQETAARDKGVANTKAAFEAADSEAKRIAGSLAEAIDTGADFNLVQGLSEASRRAETRATDRRAAYAAAVERAQDAATAEVDQIVKNAQDGVGAAQVGAQEKLANFIAGAGGPRANIAADQLRDVTPDTMRERRVLTEEGKAQEKASLMELERAKKEKAEAARKWGADFDAMVLEDQEAEAERKAKRQGQERDRRERAAYVRAFTTPASRQQIARDLDAAGGDPRALADLEARVGAQAAALPGGAGREPAELGRQVVAGVQEGRRGGQEIGQAARFFATPAMQAQIGEAYGANEARQAFGLPARTDDQERAGLESQVARRIAGQPGTEGKERQIAGEMVAQVIADHNRKVFELVQQTQDQQAATLAVYRQLEAELMQLRAGAQQNGQQLSGAAVRRRTAMGRF